jgi:hypothetical protein
MEDWLHETMYLWRYLCNMGVMFLSLQKGHILLLYISFISQYIYMIDGLN